MPRPAKSTTAKGLGWPHQQQVKVLRHNHVDGSPCFWCGLPMFLDDERNWDRRPLAGDHSLARTNGGTKADRLLHSTCNKQRGDGSRDDKRPAVTGIPVTESISDDLGHRSMPWPI